MSRGIKYKSGFKYQLAADYSVKNLPIRPAEPITTPFIVLTRDGDLLIRKGYAWDGPSGPTIDTKNFMRGSLVHDALYQLKRNSLLHVARDDLDRLLQRHCREDGMWRIRAWWVYQGVRFGGGLAADPDNKRPILVAP